MNMTTAAYFAEGSRTSYVWGAATTLYCLAAALACGCTDIPFLILATINAAVCSLMIFAPGSGPFSLNKFINLFILIFFVLANSVQYASGACATAFAATFSRDAYLLFQGLTFAGLLAFNGLYLAVYFPASRRRGRSLSRTRRKANGTRLVILSAAAAVVIFAFCGFDIPTMFSRGGWQRYADSSWMAGRQEVMLLFQRVVRPVPACCLLIGILTGAGSRRIAVLLAIALAASFPTAMPRSLAAALWLPPVLAVAGRYLHRDAAMLLMIFCILIAFPLLDSFRYADEGRDIEYGTRYFNTLNYDASQMTMAAVETDTVTGGRQLLGAVAFFAPRRVWPDKPEGSGHLIAGMRGAAYRNVSMPWFGEGYVNFGWTGVAVFTLVLALAAAACDARFKPKDVCGGNGVISYGCYLILIASILFLMRGSLMASLSALTGNIVSYVACCLATTRRQSRTHA